MWKPTSQNQQAQAVFIPGLLNQEVDYTLVISTTWRNSNELDTADVWLLQAAEAAGTDRH